MYYDLKLDTQPTTSLDEILNFINYYGYKGKINYGRFSFNDGIQFKSQERFIFFKSLLNLHLENAINLELKSNPYNEFNKKNKEFDNFLKNHRREEKGILAQITNGGNYKVYEIPKMRLHIDGIKDKLKTSDGIEYNITIKGYTFLTLLFSKITEEFGYDKINIDEIAKELYNNIYEQTGNKNNYLGKITIFYHFYKNYLNDNRIILPIISELEKNGNLKIKNIELYDDFIFFEIEKINNISENIIKNIASKIPNKGNNNIIVEYTNEGFYINQKEIEFKSKKTKIYDLYKIIFDCFNENKTNKVSYGELIKLLSRFPNKYPNLEINFFMDYDSKIRKDIQAKNKNIKFVKELIGIGKAGIWCDYYSPEK